MRVKTSDAASIADALRNRELFKTHGSLHGNSDHITIGQLPRPWQESARQADYVIYSYQTPIAWVSGDAWTVPETKYSITTTRHQATICRAISLL